MPGMARGWVSRATADAMMVKAACTMQRYWPSQNPQAIYAEVALSV